MSKEQWNPSNLLLLQEVLFSKTHADLVVRIFGRSGVHVTDDARADIVAALIGETKDLLFVHRGAAVAGWMMEVAADVGAAPGFPGLKPADLEKGIAERTVEALQKDEARELKPSDPGGEGCSLGRPPLGGAVVVAKNKELIETLAEVLERQRELCGKIEGLPASPWQTEMSVLAAGVAQSLQSIIREGV